MNRNQKIISAARGTVETMFDQLETETIRLDTNLHEPICVDFDVLWSMFDNVTEEDKELFTEFYKVFVQEKLNS